MGGARGGAPFGQRGVLIPLELETLKSVMTLIEGTDIVEVELEEGGRKVRVRRGKAVRAAVTSSSPGAAVAPAPAPSSGPPPGAVPVDTLAGHHQLKSPIVGTFYRSADPTAAPFAKVGDTVRKGQVVCIVEAMKLMNEIESDVAGEILKVHPENGHPVQFGEPLFTIKTA